MEKQWFSSGTVCAAFITAGVFFAAYPATRPFSSETGAEGAAAFGSVWWLVAHVAAMLAFISLLLGLIGWAAVATMAVRLRGWVIALAVLGVGLILPFYGAEAYALHAIGSSAVEGGVDALAVVPAIRDGVGLVLFLLGAVAWAGSLVAVARAAGPATMERWGAVVLSAAAVLFVPQFFAPQPIRVAHGLLFLAGCVLFGTGVLRRPDAVDRWDTPLQRNAGRNRSADHVSSIET